MSWLDFIIIGAQKAGTTSLSVNLSQHPAIAMDEREDPLKSEVHFFDEEAFFGPDNKCLTIKQVADYKIYNFFYHCESWYLDDLEEKLVNLSTQLLKFKLSKQDFETEFEKGRRREIRELVKVKADQLRTDYRNESTLFLYKCRLFYTLNKLDKSKLKMTTFEEISRMDRLRADKLVGEKTPVLMTNSKFIERICMCFPDWFHNIKLIVSLRDPISRAYSQWQMKCQDGSEKETFGDCVTEEILRISNNKPTPEKDKLYVYRGLYKLQLRNIYDNTRVKHNQVYVMYLENMFENSAREYNNLLRFLDVKNFDEIFVIKRSFENKPTNPLCLVKMSDAIMSIMKTFYRLQEKKEAELEPSETAAAEAAAEAADEAAAEAAAELEPSETGAEKPDSKAKVPVSAAAVSEGNSGGYRTRKEYRKGYRKGYKTRKRKNRRRTQKHYKK